MHMFSIPRPEMINYMYRYMMICNDYIKLGKNQILKMTDKKALPDMKE